MSSPRRALPALAWLVATAVVALVVPPLASPSYGQLVVELAAIYVIATAGLNVAIGFTGQFQMAQAAFMALGAYTTSILVLDHGWSFWTACGVAVAFGLALGLLVGLVALRTRSHYLLLATFGLQLITINVLSQMTITGGVNGRPAVPSLPIAGELLGSTRGYSVAVIVVAGVGLFVADHLRRSFVGLGMHASRQNERLAVAAGLYPARFRLVALLISAVYGTIAGVLIGPVLTFLVPDSFGLDLTLLLLLMVIVGGAGSVVGVALGAVALTVVSQTAQGATTAWPLIYGLAIMVMLVVAPSGLAGAGRVLTRRFGGQRGARPQADLPGGEPAATGGTSLTITDVRRHFGGVKALSSASMTVQAGTVHGLIGPNGSGKTTLFDIVCGFVTADAGRIELGGREITRLSPTQRVRLGVGRTFQHPSVLRDNTVLETVLLARVRGMPVWRRLRRLAASQGAAEVAGWDALRAVGLEQEADRLVHDLPYGQQRLVDLARVLAGGPSIVLLDEPGAGISGQDRETLRKVITTLRGRGLTVCLIDHDMRLVMEICDRITVLNTGVVIADGTPKEVAHDPAVIEAYLGTEVVEEQMADVEG